MRVFINPGHDKKYDSGAVSPGTGLREADVVADVSAMAANYLATAGIEVKILQSDNLNGETPGLPCVCKAANMWPADIFVSIHCNAAANVAAQGTETLCFRNGSAGEKLAGFIQKQIIDSLDTVDRGVKIRNDLTVLRRTDMPACLVELAFISNACDEKLLTENLDDFARAIARGITDYQLSTLN